MNRWMLIGGAIILLWLGGAFQSIPQIPASPFAQVTMTTTTSSPLAGSPPLLTQAVLITYTTSYTSTYTSGTIIEYETTHQTVYADPTYGWWVTATTSYTTESTETTLYTTTVTVTVSRTTTITRPL